MLNEDCRRWMTLVDRKACDEPLSLAELCYVEKHAINCPDCGRESAMWHALGEVLHDPSLLDQPLEQPLEPAYRGDERSRGKFAWSKIPRWVSVTSLLGAAALLAITYGFAHLRTSAPVLAGERTPKWRLSSASGEVTLGQHPARAGDLWDPSLPLRTAKGQACATLEGKIAVCLDADSELSMGQLGPSSRSVRLLRGKVISKLAKQSPGHEYAVLAGDHAVVAKGTEFIVARGSPRDNVPQDSTVRLYEGTIDVRPTRGTPTRITAPVAASLGAVVMLDALDETSSALDAPLRDIVSRPLGDRLSSAPRILEVLSRPAGAKLVLDDQVIGVTPVSVMLEGAGTQGSRLSLEKDGYAPVTEFLAVRGQDHVHRSYELSALGERPGGEPTAPKSLTTAETRKTEERTVQVTAKDWMLRSQALRSAGKTRESVDALRQLVQKFPESAEARVSWVTLGELELNALGQPGSALRSFEAYLRLGGPLVREAQYGKIRALYGLSRSAEALRATEDFIAKYPNSVQASKLRANRTVK